MAQARNSDPYSWRYGSTTSLDWSSLCLSTALALLVGRDKRQRGAFHLDSRHQHQSNLPFMSAIPLTVVANSGSPRTCRIHLFLEAEPDSM